MVRAVFSKFLALALFVPALAVFAPAMAAAPVDVALLGLVPPDAKMLVGVQVAQIRSTPFGEYLISQVHLDPGTSQLMTAVGFDLRRDLQQIVAASGESLSGGLLLGRGSFHPDKISAAARSQGAVASTYRGVALIESTGIESRGFESKSGGKNPSGAIAFLDASTLLAGDTLSVKAAIDRHAAGTVFSGPLVERARLIGGASDAWLASLTPPAGSLGLSPGALGPFGNVLQAALQLSAGLKFSAAEVTLSADVLTRSAQDAQSMADLLRFAATLLQGNRSHGGDSPKSPDSPGAPAGAPSLADAAKITSSGSVTHLVVSVSEKELERIFLSSPGQPKKIASRE
jgi:hypothetical protein